MSINARNLDLVTALNPRCNVPNVDDKLLTKQILHKQGVPLPPTLAVFERLSDLRGLEAKIAPLPGFAVKPAFGSGGRGILVIKRDEQGRLVRPQSTGMVPVDVEFIREHLTSILAGVFCPEKLHNKAFLEHLLVPEEVLGGISFQGLPDIRVLICRGKAVMAMLRLPTRDSEGHANLHQGAIGVGVNVETGLTHHAIRAGESIKTHPDTGRPLIGIRIPQWDQIVPMAIHAAGYVGLGYIGADVAIDRSLGPVIVELNARPGLAIQLANRQGLVPKVMEALDGTG